ncbi:MAG TPA: DUF2723 domain-containing protein [archaeon]|nr:DUF2723 domain-containing protein [archaeon]
MYKKEHLIGVACTFLFVLVVYLLTMAPTVTFWDAGEFIAASYTLGIPHPPGTPLFVIIGRVISSLPLNLPTALRLNFLSVLLSSLGAGLIYLITVKILETWVKDKALFSSRVLIHGGAFVSAIIPASLVTVWSNSTEFEVYAVATATIFFCAWLMTYMGSLKESRRIKNILLLVIYLVSLSIANHLIVLLVAPAVIIFTLIHDRDNWRYWCSVLGSFLGLYLLVLKGLDLSSVAARLSSAYTPGEGLLVSVYRHVIATIDIIFGFPGYVGNWSNFFLGALIAAGSIYWAYRKKALGFFGAALGLFLLGFSIHLYLLIRSGLNPPINEGQPDNLKALWSVIGREQYGSAYGIFPRLVWTLATGKHAIFSVSDLFENIKFYFMYNVPFYTKYFGWQYGNYWLTGLFFIIGLYGALEHYRCEKKSFFFWLTVFLITGPVLNTYMNFKFGYSQFLDAYPDTSIHEVRERDYFFIISFAFFGVWAGLGLAGLVNRLRLAFRMDSDKPLLGCGAFASLSAVIFLAAFIPLYSNYDEVDRSGNFIPPNYARNIMNSLEPGGIIFTNGDNDTFPLWYIQEVEGVRKDCRVVNLSLLNTIWYIRQMRDLEPRVPISFGDETIEKMIPLRLPKDLQFKMGEMEITFAKDEAIYVKDFMVLDILRTNKWQKPLYFTTTVPIHNRTSLDPYLTMVGSVYRINPRKAADIAATDSNLALVPGQEDIYMDIEGTRRLLYEVYTYDTFFRKKKGGEEANVRLASHFVAPFAWLAHAYQQRNQFEKALDANLKARMLYENPHHWDFAIAMLYARTKKYNEARAMMDSFMDYRKEAVSPNLFQQLAQEAINNDDTFEATKFLERALEIEPKFRSAYANLFRIYDLSGNNQAAIESIVRYLNLFPDDQTVKEELQKYRETGKFDLQKAFGISSE